MNIICLYWTGDFRGRDYTASDVERLRQSVDKHIDRPYEFYCLTNDMKSEMPAKKIELKHNWPGWWAKMELHRSDLPEGRTLYLDLDSHVVGDLSPILDYPGNLVMFNSRLATMHKSTPGVVSRYQAATMLFDPGSVSGIYDRFRRHPNHYMSRYRSDQDIMGVWIPDQPTFPDHWMEKLNLCRHRTVPPEGVIIITGRPGDGSFRYLDIHYPWLDEVARGVKVE